MAVAISVALAILVGILLFLLWIMTVAALAILKAARDRLGDDFQADEINDDRIDWACDVLVRWIRGKE